MDEERLKDSLLLLAGLLWETAIIHSKATSEHQHWENCVLEESIQWLEISLSLEKEYHLVAQKGNKDVQWQLERQMNLEKEKEKLQK